MVKVYMYEIFILLYIVSLFISNYCNFFLLYFVIFNCTRAVIKFQDKIFHVYNYDGTHNTQSNVKFIYYGIINYLFIITYHILSSRMFC